MLVITRKEGESIFIGDNVKITIVKIGTKVRVGIAAPPDVNIAREELLEPKSEPKPEPNSFIQSPENNLNE